MEFEELLEIINDFKFSPNVTVEDNLKDLLVYVNYYNPEIDTISIKDGFVYFNSVGVEFDIISGHGDIKPIKVDSCKIKYNDLKKSFNKQSGGMFDKAYTDKMISHYINGQLYYFFLKVDRGEVWLEDDESIQEMLGVVNNKFTMVDSYVDKSVEVRLFSSQHPDIYIEIER